ncbi:hypothetical protein ACIBMZ_26635 [Micromonospora sp. NPDC049900]|uniref:hypothetical protein n=1 Tax=Micromonospora sp. NPDC049900 TaxID=3364275 RepID=UPI00378E268D
MTLVAGCGRQPDPNGDSASAPSQTPPSHHAAVQEPPPAAGIDYTDPGQVCRALVSALFSADTRRDAGPGAAYQRASAFMDGALAAQSQATRHDGRWATWTANRARLTVEQSAHADIHQPPDSSVEAYRAQRATVTPVGVNGWRGWTEHTTVYCTLRRTDSGWRVRYYDLVPARS